MKCEGTTIEPRCAVQPTHQNSNEYGRKIATNHRQATAGAVSTLPFDRHQTPASQPRAVSFTFPFDFPDRMLHRLSFSSLIAVLASLLMVALMPLISAGLSASHAPPDGRFEQIGPLAASDYPDATHQHDATVEGDSTVTHRHAHFSADHSHDSPSCPSEHALLAGGREPRWQAGAQIKGKSAVLGMPERPPKPAAA